MNGPALPSFKWLLAGALAAGIWVVKHDMSGPRPPERVPPAKTASFTKPRAVAPKAPEVVPKPAMRPQKLVTGSIAKPDKPATRQLQTSARVRVRGKADIAAPVIFMLEGGQPVRELARDGKWRLVTAAGRKGWVHGDYLTVADAAVLRPKVPVPQKPAAKPASAVKPVKKP